MSDTTNERDWVKEIGAPAYGSIAEMVAALDCDYERLEELRDERKDLEDAKNEADADVENADEGEEEDAEEAASEATTALETWDAENADELKELEAEAGECKDADEARERIEEDALSVEVRSGWVSIGSEMTAEEFCILLTTGGPAVRIRGELDNSGEPHRAWLEVQDWGKAWTQYFPADQDVLLSYCRVFCFNA